MALRVVTLKSMRAGVCRFTPAGRQAQLHTARRVPQAGVPRTAGAVATAVALGGAAYALGSAPVHADTGSERPSIYDRVKRKGGPISFIFGTDQEKREHPSLEEGFLSRHDAPTDMVDDIKKYVQDHPGGAVKLSSEHSVPLPLDGTEQPAPGTGGAKQIEAVQSGTPRAGATAQKLASTAEGTAESSAEKGKRLASEGEEAVRETAKEGGEAIKEAGEESKDLFLSRHDPPMEMVDDIGDYVKRHPGGSVTLSSEHSVPMRPEGEHATSGSGGSKQIETLQSGTPRLGEAAQKLASTAEGTVESSAEKGKKMASEGAEDAKEAAQESQDLFLSRHDPPMEMVDDIGDYVKQHPGGPVKLSSEHSLPQATEESDVTVSENSTASGSKHIEAVRSGTPGVHDTVEKTAKKGKQASENLFSQREPGKDEAPPSMEQTAEEAEKEESAYNEDTGEINWDCPCLGGMAHGPCGEEFKQAFSCFVYSEQEPKGIDCVDKFKQMQDCFRKHPEEYADEIAADDAANAEQDE